MSDFKEKLFLKNDFLPKLVLNTVILFLYLQTLVSFVSYNKLKPEKHNLVNSHFGIQTNKQKKYCTQYTQNLNT